MPHALCIKIFSLLRPAIRCWLTNIMQTMKMGTSADNRPELGHGSFLRGGPFTNLARKVLIGK